MFLIRNILLGQTKKRGKQKKVIAKHSNLNSCFQTGLALFGSDKRDPSYNFVLWLLFIEHPHIKSDIAWRFPTVGWNFEYQLKVFNLWVGRGGLKQSDVKKHVILIVFKWKHIFVFFRAGLLEAISCRALECPKIKHFVCKYATESWIKTRGKSKKKKIWSKWLCVYLWQETATVTHVS